MSEIWWAPPQQRGLGELGFGPGGGGSGSGLDQLFRLIAIVGGAGLGAFVVAPLLGVSRLTGMALPTIAYLAYDVIRSEMRRPEVERQRAAEAAASAERRAAHEAFMLTLPAAERAKYLVPL